MALRRFLSPLAVVWRDSGGEHGQTFAHGVREDPLAEHGSEPDGALHALPSEVRCVLLGKSGALFLAEPSERPLL